jgi:hypothetical protein
LAERCGRVMREALASVGERAPLNRFFKTDEKEVSQR